MPQPSSVLAHQTVQCSTITHHHDHTGEKHSFVIEQPRLKGVTDDADTSSVGSDEEQECSSYSEKDDENDENVEDDRDIEENGRDEDDEETQERGNYMQDDVDTDYIHYKRCTLGCGHDAGMSHGFVKDNRHFDCHEFAVSLDEEIVLATPQSSVTIGKRKNRLRDLAGKAKEHMRDEDNRKRAVQMFQDGVREVSTFIAEVQASEKASAGLGANPKGNGKRLAKVCVKVAMQRLAK